MTDQPPCNQTTPYPIPCPYCGTTYPNACGHPATPAPCWTRDQIERFEREATNPETTRGKTIWSCVSCGATVLIECAICPYCSKGRRP